MYVIGVDLGGTNIKAGIVDMDFRIVSEKDRPTALPRPAESVCDDIAALIREMAEEAGIPPEEIRGMGIGCPGTVNPAAGCVEYSNNLGWRAFPMREYIREKNGFAPAVGNDANAAALGEVCAGSARGARSAVVITLGTGVGSGVVQNGEILTGCNCAAAEIGHMVIERGGRPCTCGRRGCLEAYASATGLINMTREAAAAHPGSFLAELAGARGPDGRTAFQAAARGDAAGLEVVETYIDCLACGLANVINIFQPEILSLGGGIAKEGETLLAPLREKVYAQVFGGRGEAYTRIVCCTLGYKAGIIGAAALARNQHDFAGKPGK